MTPQPPQANVSSSLMIMSTINPLMGHKHPFIDLLGRVYLVLNASQPNLTKACWLCYDIVPPYYEGLEVSATVSMTADINHCWWQQSRQGLTLERVTGQELYIGRVPPDKVSISNSSRSAHNFTQDQYLLPHNNIWWSCSMGLTPCVHIKVLSQTKGYCVPVRFVLRITYHTDQEFLDLIQQGWSQPS